MQSRNSEPRPAPTTTIAPKSANIYTPNLQKNMKRSETPLGANLDHFDIIWEHQYFRTLFSLTHWKTNKSDPVDTCVWQKRHQTCHVRLLFGKSYTRDRLNKYIQYEKIYWGKSYILGVGNAGATMIPTRSMQELPCFFCKLDTRYDVLSRNVKTSAGSAVKSAAERTQQEALSEQIRRIGTRRMLREVN